MAEKYEDFDRPGIRQEWVAILHNAIPEDRGGVRDEVWTAANEAAAKVLWTSYQESEKRGVKENDAVRNAYIEALRHRKQYLIGKRVDG